MDKDGVRQELKVDFGAIVMDKQKDIVILPDDIILIPSS